jgi:hypothetical protein
VHIAGRIILKLIFKKWDGQAWTGWMWLRIGTGQAAGTRECFTIPAGFTKCREFLD